MAVRQDGEGVANKQKKGVNDSVSALGQYQEFPPEKQA